MNDKDILKIARLLTEDPDVFNEGIRIQNGQVTFDFDNDTRYDDVLLIDPKVKVGSTAYFDIKFFYIFSANPMKSLNWWKQTGPSTMAQIASHLKSNQSQDQTKFIELSADIITNMDAKGLGKIDYISYLPSGSNFNALLANAIAQRTNARIIQDSFSKRTQSTGVNTDISNLQNLLVPKEVREILEIPLESYKLSVDAYKDLQIPKNWVNDQLRVINRDGVSADMLQHQINTIFRKYENLGSWPGGHDYPNFRSVLSNIYDHIINLKNMLDQASSQFNDTQNRKRRASKNVNALEEQSKQELAKIKNILEEIIGAIAHLKAEIEDIKLKFDIDQRGFVKSGPDIGKFKVKSITSKDKRGFINYMDTSQDWQTIKDIKGKTILIVDDNIDSGASISVIDRLISKDVGARNQIYYFSPLLMSKPS